MPVDIAGQFGESLRRACGGPVSPSKLGRQTAVDHRLGGRESPANLLCRYERQIQARLPAAQTGRFD